MAWQILNPPRSRRGSFATALLPPQLALLTPSGFAFQTFPLFSRLFCYKTLVFFFFLFLFVPLFHSLSMTQFMNLSSSMSFVFWCFF
ncbi:uncharacterized protein DS421_20g690120 [Arachis hypogaea]|nr:uncharacterized protein DS421_20g690120 [Arachis hypogaea]